MSFALPGFFRPLSAGIDFGSAFLYVAPDDSADLADILAGTYDFTTTDAIDGTIVVATEEGTYSAGISLNAATTYDLYSQGVSAGHYGFLDTPVGYAIFPSTLSDSEIAQAEATFVAEGAAARSAFGSVTIFSNTWRDCNSLTSFPLINTSSGTSFSYAWYGCNSLTSFPLIDTSSAANLVYAWYGCNSLTSFPTINTSSVTNFNSAWRNCSSLTSFPLINTSSGTSFGGAWLGCSSLTSFPLIDTSSGTLFWNTWQNCSSLTSFPLIDTSSGTNFVSTWSGCTSLTSFPSGFFDSWSPASVSSGVFNVAWDGCTSLTAQSVENILTSIDTSGVYGTNTGLSSGTQLSDNTIDIDYDGSTLAYSITTAITSLKSKNWAISINSVIQ